MIDTSNGGMDDPVLQAALTYIKKGWPTFPLHRRILGEDGKSRCPCGNPNCRSKGKEPLTLHGYKDGTTDEKTIQAYLRKYPHCNLGIATGEASGLLVLDIDGPEGWESILALEEKYGVLPATLTSATGRTEGGQHRVFRYPKDSGILFPKLEPEHPGIHVLGNGHYFVAPPSIHESGKTYAWIDEKAEIAELPQAWVEFLLEAQKRRLGTNQKKKGRQEPMMIEEEKIPKGSRNNRLHEIACSLVHKGKSKDLVLESVLALNDTTCTPPLGEAEVREIVESAWNYRDQGRGETLAERRIRLKLNEGGNAERLHSAFGDKVLWNVDTGEWMIHDGTVWRQDAEKRVERVAREVLESLAQEAETLEDPRDRKEMLEFAANCRKPRPIRDALEMFKIDPLHINVVREKDFNAEPHLLNCLSGVINLKDGSLIPHNPSQRFSYIVPFEYDAQAKCPRFLGFLKQILLDNPDEFRAIRSQIGYFLTGEMSEQYFFVWQGDGRNGKSVLCKVLLGILSDYGRTCMSTAFTLNRFESGTHELADLTGSRLVVSGEVPEGAQLNESVIKAITGGDKTRVRQKYELSKEVSPTYKIVLPCNRTPQISGQDEGIWRRCSKSEFNYRVSEEEEIKYFEKILLGQEAVGILAWMVAAAIDWYRDGLYISEKNRRAVARYRKESDPIARFVEECCSFEPGSVTRAKDLYRSFVEWSASNGERGMANNKFGKEFSIKFQGKVTSGNDGKGNYYLGIRIKQILC